jgi:hypothetical protein
MTYLVQRFLFLGIVIAVWVDHHRALQAGGYPFRRYWRTAWAKMNYAWKMMNPEIYQGEDTSKKVGKIALITQEAIIEGA